MNRGELKLRVSRVLGVALGTDDDAVDETAFLEELANESVLDVLARTRVNVRDALAKVTAPATEFEVDQQILRMVTLKLNGKILNERARTDLLPDSFAFFGFNRVGFGTQVNAGDEIYFLYTPLPTPMTADAHDPKDLEYGGIPAYFHRALLDYMCWNAADKLGDVGAARGEKYRTFYEGPDGMAGPGTDIGRIRGAVSSRGGRVIARRAREVLMSDRDPAYWTG